MITVDDVEDAQRAWGDGIVAIASAHSIGEDYEKIAIEHVETLYAYQFSEVLFKPTLASVQQFRGDFASALSYFVASNNACPEDTGFAIKGWTAVRFENTGIILAGSGATSMGNYFFTNSEGEETKVEYTFGYILDEENKLRINLHHSSIPANAN